MKALVLAAGYATRLYPLTLDRPKALLEVGGKPMLDHVLERLEEMGVDETIVVTNAKFTPHFEEWASGRDGVRIVNDGTTVDDDRLGAIGDIGYVLDRRGSTTTSSSSPGDNLFARTSPASLPTGRGGRSRARGPRRRRPRSDARVQPGRVDDEGRITFFEEKPEDARSTLAGVALYFYPRADAAADPAVPGRAEQPRPAGTPRRSGSTRVRRSTPGACRASGTTSAPPRLCGGRSHFFAEP